MILEDVLVHSWRAIAGHRQRSALTVLGIVIGVASVILLTSIGEGTRQYLLREFTQFGTNLVAVNPGRVETSELPGAIGGTIHPLTLEDARALERMRGVEEVVPVVMGSAAVEHGGRSRDVAVYGLSASGPEVWKMRVVQGRFLPAGDMETGSPLTVLGPELKDQLFGEKNALGEHVRIAGQRYMVVGIMEPKGQFVGMSLDDCAYIPVSLAMSMFNRDDLAEIDVQISNHSVVDSVVARIERLLIDRHSGEFDFTVTTQTGMLETLDRIMNVISVAVGGIGAISLLVGAIGILTMMWISVNERTSEIGLAKATGATSSQILWLFLGEATILSLVGGGLGLACGIGTARLIQAFVPAIPVHTPLLFVGLALVVSLGVGLASGILPARRAASMDPVEALAAE